MKPTALFLSFLGILLIAAATVTADFVPVLDSDGRILRNGQGLVYLSPVSPIGDGGIVYADIRPIDERSGPCSLAVISALYTNSWPVSVYRLTKESFPLNTVQPVHINFPFVPPSLNWLVIRSPTLGDSVMVSSALEAGFVSGSFYIRTVDLKKRHYKFVFCEEGKNQCRNIGVQIDRTGLRRLVVTDEEPLVFKFDRFHREDFDSDLSMVA